jgi:hypothetical protein
MSIKLKKKSPLVSDQKIKRMIEGQIKTILKTKYFIPRTIFIRTMEYFPVYGMCEHSGEKTITKFYCKSNLVKKFKPITVSEIEIAGVTMVEFLDYIDCNGAKEISVPGKMLNLV